jgi:hypothetical protein
VLFVIVLVVPPPAAAGQITLAWDASTEEDLAGYKVYAGDSSRLYSTTIDVGRTTSFTVSGLQEGRLYYFAITAYNTSGLESDYSEEVSGTVRDATPPAIAGVTASSISAVDATITWATNEVSDSQVEYGLTTSYGGVTPLNGSMVTTHSIPLSGLDDATLYHYRVRSRDAAGNLGTSGDFTFTTKDGTAPTVSVTAPAAGATVSGTVTVTVSASDNVGVVGVQLELDGTNLGTEDTASPYSIAWNTTTVSNAAHTLTAVARDAAGNTRTSASVTVTVSNDTSAPAISAVTASAITAAGATITWTSDEASDSQVEYGLTTSYGSVTPLNGSMVTAHSVPLTGLTDATVYHYRVRSRDAAGNLATSGDFTVTTQDGTAPVITAVAASSITKSGAAITWTTNEPSDSQVDYGPTTAYGTSTAVASSLVTSHSTTLSGLQEATLYHFRVRSRDTAGNLRISSDFTFTTKDVTAPTVSITSPAAAAVLSSTVTVTATASDNVGVAGVQFKVDGASVGAEDTTAPYSVAWNTTTTANGLHTLTAVARDAAGNVTTSAGVLVTVLNVLGQSSSANASSASSESSSAASHAVPPSISIVAPFTGVTVTGTVTLAADASDDVGVDGVQFSLNGVPLGPEIARAPYTMEWDSSTASDGVYVLTAKARDMDSRVTTAEAIALTVENGVLWLAPEDTSLTLDAKAQDDNPVLSASTWPDHQVASAILMKFDLARLPPAAVVHEATLHLALIDSDGAEVPTYSISAHKVTGPTPDVASATGQTADGTTNWMPSACCDNGVPLAQADISAAYDTRAIDKTRGYKTWTVTQMVQEWFAAAASNKGLLLNADAAELRDRYRRFASMEYPDAGLRPFLRIEYSRGAAADSTAPSVSITSPALGATAAGTVMVVAVAKDNIGVTGVQFTVDGMLLGAERVSAPYSVTWDTTGAADGSHTLVAITRDAAGNVSASPPVRVTVENGTVGFAGPTPVSLSKP